MEQKEQKEQRVSERSWTETLETIKEGITDVFPNLLEFYSLGNGVVAEFKDAKSKYQIGVVFPVTYKETGDVDHIVYYPIKGAYIQYPKLDFAQTDLTGRQFRTKRGDFEVIKFNGKQAFAFRRIFNCIINF